MEGQLNATSHLSNTKREKRGIDMADAELVEKLRKKGWAGCW